jgi:hypothetical protein
MNANINDDYNHTAAFTAAFGAVDGRWFLAKAERELVRYRAAGQSDEDRVDALLNYAASLIALEDWTYPAGDVSPGDWRARHRQQCPEHMLLALIALVAKHRALGDRRMRRVMLTSTDHIVVWTEDAVPTSTIAWLEESLPGATFHIRTVVEDDEILGYEIRVDILALKLDGHSMPVPTILDRALAYWHEQLPD